MNDGVRRSGGAPVPSQMWGRQVAAILRLELRRSFLGKRAVPIYLLAAAPVVLFAARAALPFRLEGEGLGQTSLIYAVFFQSFMLRMVIFFGCVGIFTALFRGEIQDRTLHYYFLAPARREVLVAGKYLAGLTMSSLLFAGASVLCYLLLCLPKGWGVVSEHLLRGPGLAQLAAYAGVATLACVGYGAVFLALGLFFRNVVVSSVGIAGWETINFLLPPLLKKVSVIHYLVSLCPVPVSEGPFALLAQPTPAAMAVPGLLVVTGLLLWIAAWRLRRIEILYSSG